MLTAAINTAGISLAAIGAYLLFRYGLPFRNRTGGIDHLVLGNEPNPEELAIEARADRLGWLGFGLGAVGALLQAFATWLPVLKLSP
jgi:hypothetical protein